METTRIGVFGGTFNPIHRGHLHIAHRTRKLFNLDQVHFVVAAYPPHKAHDGLVPLLHRYAMVSLATATIPPFIPSLIELENPASPYSVHTMEKFVLLNGGNRENVYFIAGGDSLLDVAGWRESRELLETYNFIFVARPGISVVDPCEALPVELGERLQDLRGRSSQDIRSMVKLAIPGGNSRIYVLDANAPDISSSQVRAWAASGKPLIDLVPSPVRQYIQKLHLYGE